MEKVLDAGGWSGLSSWPEWNIEVEPMRRVLTVVVMVALLAGCNTAFRDMQATYLPNDVSRPHQMYPRVAGEACEHRFLFFIPIGAASLNDAIFDMTKGKEKVDNLFAVQVEEKWSFWLLGSSSCLRVSAHPVTYKDNLVKIAPFEWNNMNGNLVRVPPVANTVGGADTAEPYNPRGTVPGTPYVQPVQPVQPIQPIQPVQPVKPVQPVQPVVKVPPPDPAPTQAECDAKCTTFSALWEGSPAIKATIRSGCVKKCMVKENKAYRSCIEGASSVSDISRCNAVE